MALLFLRRCARAFVLYAAFPAFVVLHSLVGVGSVSPLSLWLAALVAFLLAPAAGASSCA